MQLLPPPPPPRHSVQTNIFGSSTNKMFVGFVRRCSSTNIDEHRRAGPCHKGNPRRTTTNIDEQRRTSTNIDEHFFFFPPRRTSTNILFVCTLCLGGSTKGVLLSKTHFFEISVKKPTKMGVPGRKSPWGSPIYPNKPPDDLHRAFLV